MDLFEVMGQYFGQVTKQVVLSELQVDRGQHKVVAAGPDKAVPVVTRVTKLRNDFLPERRVFVEGEALADKIYGKD